jgi:hypothetical protein
LRESSGSKERVPVAVRGETAVLGGGNNRASFSFFHLLRSVTFYTLLDFLVALHTFLFCAFGGKNPYVTHILLHALQGR